MKFKLAVNGRTHSLDVSADTTLLAVLRDELGLFGAKSACEGGECGACTVLVDGEAISSCTMLAITARDREITTVEGLARGNQLHPLQQAFVDHGALQCGYCGSGMLMSAKALLDHNPEPTRGEVERALAGNLCRCTGYRQIVDAILDAAETVRGDAR